MTRPSKAVHLTTRSIPLGRGGDQGLVRDTGTLPGRAATQLGGLSSLVSGNVRRHLAYHRADARSRARSREIDSVVAPRVALSGTYRRFDHYGPSRRHDDVPSGSWNSLWW